jgi:GAF domain-containing protein
VVHPSGLPLTPRTGVKAAVGLGESPLLSAQWTVTEHDHVPGVVRGVSVSVSMNEAERLSALYDLDILDTSPERVFDQTVQIATGLLGTPDAPSDRRFATNPFVTGAPFVRFYAGAPLVSSDGAAVGSLCVLDTEIRTLSIEQSHALKVLAEQTMTLLEGRRDRRRLNDALQRITADLMPWQV